MYATFLQNIKQKVRLVEQVYIHFIVSFKVEKKNWLYSGQQKLEEEILC